jgi:hypothetical protein
LDLNRHRLAVTRVTQPSNGTLSYKGTTGHCVYRRGKHFRGLVFGHFIITDNHGSKLKEAWGVES